MDIEINILNRSDFGRFVSDFFFHSNNNFGENSFLQSSSWGDIQERYKRKCFYLSFKKSGVFLGFSLIIEIPINNFFKYWYIPRGPVFKEDVSDKDEIEIFSKLSDFAKKNNIVFIRFESNSVALTKEKNAKKTNDVQPSKTCFIDIRQSRVDLLKGMKSKTRYNISLAKKKGVKIISTSNHRVAFDNFIKLMKETSERDGFYIHAENYYKNLISYNNHFIRVFEAHYNGQVIASGIFSFYRRQVSYLHGASSNQFRNVMAPYLLHFETMISAKKEGYKFYDLYGVNDSKWPGVSRFKRGFGGEQFDYQGTFDWPVKKGCYKLYRFIRFLRSFKF